ncbi:hypothetical protein B0H14DRAFT_3733528 [Mycena olivaceomarginata]|nr:hypothetical protein B0H14DRAFT_3733528 [Mycena olivaceomarginata]
MSWKHDGGGFTDALRLAVEADLKKQRQLREGKPVGRRYEGVEVLVVFDSPFKGMRGIVVGDFDSPGRAARIQKCKQVKDDDGIMVTVQKERSNARFTLDIKKLVHVHTRMPLSKTKAVPDWMLAPRLAPQPARASTPLPPSRLPTPPPQASWMPNSRVLDGELDGRWLCLPGLVNKRVDVILKDIASSENRYFRAQETNSQLAKAEPPFREEDLDKKMIRVWAVGPKRNQPPGLWTLYQANAAHGGRNPN